MPKQVLTFGDGENDIDMFQKAGFSVAMSNPMPIAAAARYDNMQRRVYRGEFDARSRDCRRPGALRHKL